MAKHDWPVIKSEYIQGIADSTSVIYPTYEELAKRHGLSAGYLRAKAGRENWSEQKALFIAKMEQKKIENRSDKLASQQSEFDFEIFKTTKNLLAYAKARMNKLNRELQSNTDFLPSLNEIDQLAKIIKQVQDIGKRALGEDPSGNDFEIRVEVV